MRLVLALDGDEAGQAATLDTARIIGDYFASWGQPKSAGPTAQALATAQLTYDELTTRLRLWDGIAAPDDIRQLEWEVEQIADYMVGLYESEKHNVDKDYVKAQTIDEFLLLDGPALVMQDVATLDFAALKQRLVIMDLVSADVGELRPAGSGKWKAPCTMPDHLDSHPSMWVYPDTNSFYCWSCKAGGDAIDYLRKTGKRLSEY